MEEVPIRKLPPNRGSSGRGTLGSHPTTVSQGLDGSPGKRGPRFRKSQKEKPVTLETALKRAKRDAKAELEQEIQSGEHYLAFPIYDRMEIRGLHQQGLSIAKISQQFQTSPKVVKRILEMKEDLSREREGVIAETFFRTGALLRRILSQVTDEKIQNASLSQQLVGVGILSDKMVHARKALDGEAAIEVKHSHYGFEDRQQLLEAVRQKWEDLRPVLQADYEVISEEGSQGGSSDVGPTSLPAPAPPPQLSLFSEKEPSGSLEADRA